MVGNFGTNGDPNLSPTRGCAVTLGPKGQTPMARNTLAWVLLVKF